MRRYGKGIVSLAERSICPLMWSHYGDQHRGICIGYSVPDGAESNLYKVSYGGSRLIAASDVEAMLAGDVQARRRVDNAVITKKAGDWRYEREWRLVGPRGLQDSPLELEDVTFGMRCTRAAQYAVVKALEDRSRTVKFYEINERRGRFQLSKHLLNLDELCVSLPQRALDLQEAFDEEPK